MPANPLIFKDAEKARDALLVSQKKEIAALYQQWADEIGERADYYAHKSTASSVVSERQMRELQKMMEETSKQVANEVYNDITRNLYTVADSVVRCNDEWLASLGFNPGTVDAIFNYVPDDIVRNIVSGQIYDSGWSLSSRIWSDNEDTMKQAYQIVAGGVAQNKPMYEIAKDLEKYVSPSAVKPWNLRAPDGKKIYPKDVDYNAQRLGRTLVQHGYQQSFVATTQKNPFITDYIWISNGSRVCDLCAERDRKHFSKDDLPLDHPNGMCTMAPNVVDDLTDQLADWFNSEDGTYPEIDQFASNFGYYTPVANNIQNTGKHLTFEGEKERLEYLRKLGFSESDYSDYGVLDSIYDYTKSPVSVWQVREGQTNPDNLREMFGSSVERKREFEIKLAQGNYLEAFIRAEDNFEGMIYRGISLDSLEGFGLNDIIDMKGISSWTSDFDVARYYSGDATTRFGRSEASVKGRSVIFEMKNKSGVSINGFSTNTGHQDVSEVLLSKDAKMKIGSIIEDGKNVRIILEELL